MKAADEATHYLKDKVGLKEADRIVAAVRAEAMREAANGLVALGPVDSLVSAPQAWTEAIETLRLMADQTT
jgi:hypothetical protein